MAAVSLFTPPTWPPWRQRTHSISWDMVWKVPTRDLKCREVQTSKQTNKPKSNDKKWSSRVHTQPPHDIKFGKTYNIICKRIITVAHICHGKLTFPRQNLLSHDKTYFSTAKLILTAKLTLWWKSDEKDVDQFVEQANKFHVTIKFMAEISENEPLRLLSSTQWCSKEKD